MITVDENEIAPEEELLSSEEAQNKANIWKDALLRGEMPDDLKSFISSLQESNEDEEVYEGVTPEESSEVVDETEDAFTDDDDEEEEDISSDSTIVENNEASVQDLNEIF